MKLLQYGVSEEGPGAYELVRLFSGTEGRWILIAGKRQEIEIRITPGGMLRVSKPRKRGPLRASGPKRS